MFSYQFAQQAAKEIKRLPKNIQRQVFADILAVCKLRHPLQSKNVLKLRGDYDTVTFRLRSGNYRIIFRVINESLVIRSIRHRQKGY